MKKVIFFLLFLYLGILGSLVHAQLPNASHTDFSTKTGTYTDTRDNKTYAYKKYGNFEWFIQNLSYDKMFTVAGKTVKGIYLPQDPAGKRYGMVYPSSPENSLSFQSENLCPEGWSAASATDYFNLFRTIISEYGIKDEGMGEKNNHFQGISKYIRAGGVKGTDANGLWSAGTIIDPLASKIGFNALPAGTFNIDKNEYDREEDKESNKAAFLTGGTSQLMVFYNSETASDWNRVAAHHSSIRCFRPHFPEGEIMTPYPTTIEVKQIDSASKESARLCQNLKKSDWQPTGFYLEKGKKLVLDMEQLMTSTDGAQPQAIIGTMGQVNNSPKEFNLKVGVNTVTGDAHEGGLIYLRYVTENANNPQGKVSVTFTAESQQVRAPRYVYGVTTDPEFATMLSKYQTPDVVFLSDYSLVIARRKNAISISMQEDKKKWMDILHTVLKNEDEISGLDNNDPNPIHHRLKAGEVRYMYIETESLSPHATHGYTAYPLVSPKYYLSYETIFNESWMMGHEVGHQHQQGAYQVDKSTESTVNIYSYVNERYMQSQMGNNNYNRTSAEHWAGAQKYLELPMKDRIYNMDDGKLEDIVGFNRDILRFMPWEQLFIMFGDDFYKVLHRVVREEKQRGASEQEKRAYLAWKASEITGYDLSGFFNEWGIQMTEPYYVEQVKNKIANSGSIAAMPEDDKALTRITGQNRPSWAPLAMKGITSSKPEIDDQPTDRLASKNKYCDYSSQSGVFVDARDQKEYPYKQYGKFDWFMTNLDWDGFDGVNAESKGTIGHYGKGDTDGKVYGRMYPTNPAYIGINPVFCPQGWSVAGNGDFDQLLKDVQADFKIAGTRAAIKCMKCGGDRDVVADGLWAKGAADLNLEMAAKVGINFLPAGVYTDLTDIYEVGDEEGRKAAFVNEGWYHNIYSSGSNDKEFVNRYPENHGSVRCVRPSATMLSQVIVFEKLEDVTLSTPDFDAGATVDSNLPISYASSNQGVAKIVEGKIQLVNVGTTTITASQEGNDLYHPASPITQSLTVLPSDLSVEKYSLMINKEQGWKVGDTYTMPCDGSNKVEIFVNVEEGMEVIPSNPFYATVENPSVKEVKYQIKAGGTAVDASINIEKRMTFADVVQTKWGYTYIVNNNPKFNGGYTFTNYQWFKNGIQVHNGQYYVASNSDVGTYSLELTTNKGQKINTCAVDLKPVAQELRVYPTVVAVGEPVYIDASSMDQAFLNKSSVKVSSMAGHISSNKSITEELTTIQLPTIQGVYIITIVSDDLTKTVKVIVK